MILIVYCDINLSFIFRQFPSSQNCRIQTYHYKRFTSLFYTLLSMGSKSCKNQKLSKIWVSTVSYTLVQAHRIAEIRLANVESYTVSYTTVHGLTELQKSDLPIQRVILFLYCCFGSQNCRNQTCQYEELYCFHTAVSAHRTTEIQLANIESFTVSYTPVQAHRMAEIRLANVESYTVTVGEFC